MTLHHKEIIQLPDSLKTSHRVLSGAVRYVRLVKDDGSIRIYHLALFSILFVTCQYTDNSGCTSPSLEVGLGRLGIEGRINLYSEGP